MAPTYVTVLALSCGVTLAAAATPACAADHAVIYDFHGSDGEQPGGSLVSIGTTLYGTTNYGDSYNQGTVFALYLQTGTETVLHSFGTAGDGTLPGSLIKIGTRLYGTSFGGGAADCSTILGPGCGTVFSFDPSSGREAIVHSFHGGSHAEQPRTSLVRFGSRLYGTADGGAFGQGAVFWVNPVTGAEKVAYSFQGGSDGANPNIGGLINVDGTLYGVTSGGGSAGCSSGCGTVFAVKP